MTPIRPTTFAQMAGLERSAFVSACESGDDTHSGFPIGDWVHRTPSGGLLLHVPDKVADAYTSGRGSSTVAARPNPAPPPSKWAEATTAAAGALPAMSANASASHAVASMANAVEKHPALMLDITDALVLLGSGGLMLAATEEGQDYRAATVAGGAAGIFALWKVLRQRREDQAQQRVGQLPRMRQELPQQPVRVRHAPNRRRAINLQ